MNEKTFDLIVIGAGPAGYSAAVRASQLGARVLLIEKTAFGGTCLNWGCVPTKFMWEAAHELARFKRASSYGITAGPAELSFPDLISKKDKAVELLTKGVKQLLAGYGVTMLEGAAVFSGPGTIEIVSGQGVGQTYTTPKIIIAAGSSPSGIPGYPIDHDKIIDSTDALNLKTLPQSLLVVGGGAIGVEFASIYAALGTQVNLVEKEAQLLPGEDAELAEEVKKSLVRQGVKVETAIASFDELAKNSEKLLIAAGRKSNAGALNPEKAGIKSGPKNLEINEYLETSTAGIYCAGDAGGRSLLAYTAQAEGVLAAENALGKKKAVERSVIPKAVFSNPPAASVGTINASGLPESVTGRFDLAANSRAFIEGERRGWVKICADKKTGIITGGQIIGAGAEELITAVSIAVKQKLTLQDLSREIFFHPSLSEAVHCACEDALGKCVDLPRK